MGDDNLAGDVIEAEDLADHVNLVHRVVLNFGFNFIRIQGPLADILAVKD